MKKRLNALSVLLFLLPTINAMQQNQQRQADSRPDVLFLEMQSTGLDPNSSAVLDIVALVVDPDLTYVKKEVYSVVYQGPNILPRDVLDTVNPCLKSRIIESGLHESVCSPRASSLREAECKLLQALGEQQPVRHLLLVGDSHIKLYHQFLRLTMPQVHALFSCKEPINVASLRTLIILLHPDDEFETKRAVSSQDRAHLLLEELKHYNNGYLNKKQILADNTLYITRVLELSHRFDFPQ